MGKQRFRATALFPKSPVKGDLIANSLMKNPLLFPLLIGFSMQIAGCSPADDLLKQHIRPAAEFPKAPEFQTYLKEFPVPWLWPKAPSELAVVTNRIRGKVWSI